MLQRIQSLFLLIGIIISGGLSFVFSFWKNIDGVEYFMIDLLKEEDWRMISIPVSFMLSSILSIISLGSFKNRKKQIRLNRFNLIVNLYLLGIIVYLLLSLPGESNISEKGIGLFLPVLVIVCLALANKTIKKDEELVKSVDRLR